MDLQKENINNIIMKKLCGIISFVLILFSSSLLISKAETSKSENIQKVRAGTFIKVMPREEFSTLTADIGDELIFINVQDMYVYETNAIPQNTIFYGEVEDVREPVAGKDGAIKVAIYKMITPDKKVYRLTGHIYSENENYLGGKDTAPIYYQKVPHYIKGLRPMLQAAPLHIYEQGQHTIIKPGEDLFLILEKDIILK